MFDIVIATASTPQAPGVYVLLALLGCAIGVLTGFFGAGGGFILTPGLNIFFAIPFPNAVGISLAQIFVTCAFSAFKHWRRRNVDIKLSAIMAAAACVGSLVGKQLMQLLETHAGTLQIGAHSYPLLGLVMKGLFLVLLTLVMVSMLRETGRAARQAAPGEQANAAADTPAPGDDACVSTALSRWLHGLQLSPLMSFPRSGIPAMTFWAPLCLSLVVGVMTGLMGVGGGFVLFPLLVYVLGVPTVVAAGTSAFQIVFATGIGTLAYWQDGKIWWPVVAALLLGSLTGVNLGVWLAGRCKALHARRYFAYVIGLGVAIIVFSLARDLFFHSAGPA